MKNLFAIVLILVSYKALASTEVLEIQCRNRNGNVLTYNTDKRLTIKNSHGHILVDLENMVLGSYMWVESTMVSPIFQRKKGPVSIPYGTIYESREGKTIKIKNSTYDCGR